MLVTQAILNVQYLPRVKQPSSNIPFYQ